MDVGEKTFPSKSNHTAAISGSICSLRIFIPATLWHLRAVTSRHETERRRADYRSMNEVRLKYELIKLEKKILDITGDPIDYKHDSPFLDWCRDDAKVEAVEKMMLDRSYILNLLFDIHCTPAEVAYQKSINNCNMRR